MLRRAFESLFPFARFERHDRGTVAIIWLMAVVGAFAGAHASSTIPFSRLSLGLSTGDMSLILAVARLGGMVALVFSWWSDRSGRRRPLIASFLVLIFATMLTGAVQEGWQFGALQAVARMAAAAMGTLAVVLLAEHIAPALRAFAVGLYGAGSSFGAGLGLVALPLADGSPDAWRGLFYLAGVGLVIIPFMLRTIREPVVFISEQEHSTRPLRDLLVSPFRGEFWVASSINFLVNVFTSVALAFSIERLIDDLGFTTGRTVVISLVGGTVGGLGFFLGGRLADVAGRRITSVLSLIAAGVGGVTVYYLTDPVWLTVAVAVSTFGTFAFVPSAASHRTELFPTGFRSTANTAGTYFGMVGSATGLLIGRFTIDVIGLSQTVAFLAIAMAVAAGLTMFLPETRGQELDRVTAPG